VADSVPDCLQVTALSADGCVMAVTHESLPISAVQFHPESILSMDDDSGVKIIGNVIRQVTMPDRLQYNPAKKETQFV
jgi:anthranilate synthase